MRYGSGLHKEGPWDTVFESSPPQYFLSSPSPNPPIFLPTQPLHEQNIFWGNFSKASSLSPQKYFSLSLSLCLHFERKKGRGSAAADDAAKAGKFSGRNGGEKLVGGEKSFWLSLLSFSLSLPPSLRKFLSRSQFLDTLLFPSAAEARRSASLPVN